MMRKVTLVTAKAGTGGTGHGLLQKKMAQGFAGGQGTATEELLTQGTAGEGERK